MHHFASPAQCHLWGRCLFRIFFPPIKNWQPKYSAQEANILLEKKCKSPVNHKERQTISFFSSKSRGNSPLLLYSPVLPTPVLGTPARPEKQAGEEGQQQMPLLLHTQLSPAKGIAQHQHSGSPTLWYKDVYCNEAQTKLLVNKLSLEDYTLYFFHVCHTNDQKKKDEKKQLKRQYEKPMWPFDSNSVTNSSRLRIFKSWTDHLHLKFGNLINPIQEGSREGPFGLWTGRPSHQPCHLHKPITAALTAQARQFPFPADTRVVSVCSNRAERRRCLTATHWQEEKVAKIFTVKTQRHNEKIKAFIFHLNHPSR